MENISISPAEIAQIKQISANVLKNLQGVTCIIQPGKQTPRTIKFDEVVTALIKPDGESEPLDSLGGRHLDEVSTFYEDDGVRFAPTFKTIMQNPELLPIGYGLIDTRGGGPAYDGALIVAKLPHSVVVVLINATNDALSDIESEKMTDYEFKIMIGPLEKALSDALGIPVILERLRY